MSHSFSSHIINFSTHSVFLTNAFSIIFHKFHLSFRLLIVHLHVLTNGEFMQKLRVFDCYCDGVLLKWVRSESLKKKIKMLLAQGKIVQLILSTYSDQKCRATKDFENNMQNNNMQNVSNKTHHGLNLGYQNNINKWQIIIKIKQAMYLFSPWTKNIFCNSLNVR